MLGQSFSRVVLENLLVWLCRFDEHEDVVRNLQQHQLHQTCRDKKILRVPRCTVSAVLFRAAVLGGESVAAVQEQYGLCLRIIPILVWMPA